MSKNKYLELLEGFLCLTNTGKTVAVTYILLSCLEVVMSPAFHPLPISLWSTDGTKVYIGFNVYCL